MQVPFKTDLPVCDNGRFLFANDISNRGFSESEFHAVSIDLRKNRVQLLPCTIAGRVSLSRNSESCKSSAEATTVTAMITTPRHPTHPLDIG